LQSVLRCAANVLRCVAKVPPLRRTLPSALAGARSIVGKPVIEYLPAGHGYGHSAYHQAMEMSTAHAIGHGK
jgi:hypothetical protein